MNSSSNQRSIVASPKFRSQPSCISNASLAARSAFLGSIFSFASLHAPRATLSVSILVERPETKEARDHAVASFNIQRKGLVPWGAL
ncbi:hypothetical protein, partial [Roseisalinus antarcticus]|uniref:hypothetical protein n=1 Tax=Roseisalinus antarcticus TaxID=254357 RepID=UPI001F391DEC